MLIQRLADARDVAVAEDREHATEQRFDAGAVFAGDALRGQIAHQRLRHRQADRAAGARGCLRRAAGGWSVVMHDALVHAACS
ncbi:hypothetical protein QFZ99_004144 [Paraburkholderia atlantica]